MEEEGRSQTLLHLYFVP